MTADGRRVSELFLDRADAVQRAEHLAHAWGDATLYVEGRGSDESFREHFGAPPSRPSLTTR